MNQSDVLTLRAESVWRLRCAEDTSLSALPTESDFPTVDVLREPAA